MSEKPPVDVEGGKDWMRHCGELSTAFNAFTLYRDFGPLRNIKKVLKLHGLKDGLHSSWYRWSWRHDWVGRAEKYDDWMDAERLKRLAVEEQERTEAYKKMLDKVVTVVDKRLDTMRPDELTATQAVDMLDKTWELGSKVHHSAGGSSKSANPTGQLEISFVDTFDGV